MMLPPLAASIDCLLVGQPVPFGPQGQPSAIDKRPAAGPLWLAHTGLAGDTQGDPKHHGGLDKALHHYPFDHYAAWRAERPHLAERLGAPGAFGENLSTSGPREADVCIGDMFRAGRALIQISQGRQPCWKLNVRFADKQMARLVQESGRTGWYYRVLEEGALSPGDRLELVERPASAWPLTRLQAILYGPGEDFAALADMAALDLLAPSWRKLAQARLDKRKREDWTGRLATPAAQ